MITSTSNAKVKRLVSLKKKRKARDEEKVFLVEGIRMFREMPLEILREVYVSETFYRKAREVLAGSGIVPEILSDTVFGYVSDTRTPQGILCVARQSERKLRETAGGNCPHIIVLEHLQDPGNLGTILRTAEGAGVTGGCWGKRCFSKPDFRRSV